MTFRYLELDDYLAIAAEVTGLQVETLVNATKTDLADSALHARAASFGDQEFYPDFVDKAALLIVRLAKNFGDHRLITNAPGSAGTEPLEAGRPDDRNRL
ncbi:MAG TPA: hypothetical protein VNF71_04885 [Acidimicrobiales bacterium]|nr:hypothetical protein [Acidimicrobiales bacterium]